MNIHGNDIGRKDKHKELHNLQGKTKWVREERYKPQFLVKTLDSADPNQSQGDKSWNKSWNFGSLFLELLIQRSISPLHVSPTKPMLTLLTVFGKSQTYTSREKVKRTPTDLGSAIIDHLQSSYIHYSYRLLLEYYCIICKKCRLLS